MNFYYNYENRKIQSNVDTKLTDLANLGEARFEWGELSKVLSARRIKCRTQQSHFHLTLVLKTLQPMYIYIDCHVRGLQW
jgi:hypothetical protein